MLNYAVAFFVIAINAALVGFSGIAAVAVDVAQVLFVVFLMLAMASFVIDMLRRRR